MIINSENINFTVLVLLYILVTLTSLFFIMDNLICLIIVNGTMVPLIFVFLAYYGFVYASLVFLTVYGGGVVVLYFLVIQLNNIKYYSELFFLNFEERYNILLSKTSLNKNLDFLIKKGYFMYWHILQLVLFSLFLQIPI